MTQLSSHESPTSPGAPPLLLLEDLSSFHLGTAPNIHASHPRPDLRTEAMSGAGGGHRFGHHQFSGRSSGSSSAHGAPQLRGGLRQCRNGRREVS